MIDTRKLMLSATAVTLTFVLAGCSVSFEDPGAPSDSTSASPNASSSAEPSPGSSESTSPEEETIALPKPRPLPSIAADDKPSYTDPAVTTALATIVADSQALAESSGWYATVNGKVIGAFANASTLPYNSAYVIAPFASYPAGAATETPAGLTQGNLVLASAGPDYNAFANLLGVLNPNGGTLNTFNPNGSPFADALFTAAVTPMSAAPAAPTSVKYGATKSFGKYAKTPNAFSVALSPSTAGAYKDVVLWVEKVGDKEVIVGVNDVRVGYGPHPSVESAVSSFAEAIKASQIPDSRLALGVVNGYWIDVTAWWYTR